MEHLGIHEHYALEPVATTSTGLIPRSFLMSWDKYTVIDGVQARSFFSTAVCRWLLRVDV
jgi:hypothetical protein